MSENMKSVAGIILAAGTGSRMGCTKQLLPFGRTNLLGQVVRSARASDLEPVVVVLGHDAEEIMKRTDLSGTQVVFNPRYADGQAASVCAGLSAVPAKCSGAMFLLGDQPLVDHGIINTLIAAWQKTQRPMLVPYCNGRRGNPVVVGASLFEAVQGVTGDRGARALFKQYPEQIEKLDIHNPAILEDVDTREAYDRLVGR